MGEEEGRLAYFASMILGELGAVLSQVMSMNVME
jgi:hypothetical protein